MERRAYSLEQVLQDEYLDIVEQIIKEEVREVEETPEEKEEVVVYVAPKKIFGADDRIQEQIEDHDNEYLLNL
jgi:hypothetical protein